MDILMKALAWTFVHSLWQGLLAALIAAVIITTTKKTRALIRYHLLGLLFIAFLLGSLVTFFVQLGMEAEAGKSGLVQGSAGLASSSETNPGLTTVLSNWFDANASLMVLIWAIFFFVHCLQLFAGLVSVQRLRHYQTYPLAEEWETKLSQLCRLLGISHPVSILQSGLVKVPVAIGFFKPVILLPVGLVNHLPPEQVETILLHELGHIRRKDWIVNIIQHVAETIFFFNPAIRWISSLIREEREACCDDIVMDHSAFRHHYLNALVSFQEYAHQKTYAMAISSKKQYLLHRIKRMVEQENKRLSIGEKLALVCGLFLFPAFTYIDQMEKGRDAVGPKLVEQSIIADPWPGGPIGNVNAAFGGKDKEKSVATSISMKRPDNDTLPLKINKRAVGKGKMKADPSIENGSNVEKDKNAKELLLEMEQIIKQISTKKESIGVKKEKLMEKQHDIELEKEIEQERKELDLKRKELHRKSREFDELKEKEHAMRVKDDRAERDADLKSKWISKDLDKDLLIRTQVNRNYQVRNAEVKKLPMVMGRKNFQNNSKHVQVNKNLLVDNRKYAVGNRNYITDKSKLVDNRKHVLENKKLVIENRKGLVSKLERKPVDKPGQFKKPVESNEPRKIDKPDQLEQKIRKSPSKPEAPDPAVPKKSPPVRIIP
jgi:bla regulator protein BlaR1